MCDLQYQLVHYDHTTGAITNASSWFPLNEESINVDGWDGVHFREKPRRSAEEIVKYLRASGGDLTLDSLRNVLDGRF